MNSTLKELQQKYSRSCTADFLESTHLILLQIISGTS